MTYIDDLHLRVARHAGLIHVGVDQLEALLYAIVKVAGENAGLALSFATVPVGNTEILFASPRLLTLLVYPDLAAYQAAVAVPGFVDPADIEVVENHIRHRSSQPYDAGLLRGNGAGYRRLRIQGFTLEVPSSGVYRLSLFTPR